LVPFQPKPNNKNESSFSQYGLFEATSFSTCFGAYGFLGRSFFSLDNFHKFVFFNSFPLNNGRLVTQWKIFSITTVESKISKDDDCPFKT